MEIEYGIVSKYGPMVFAYMGIGFLIHTVVILFGAVLYSGNSIGEAPVVWPSRMSWFLFATAWPAMLLMGGVACAILGVAHILVHALADEPTRPLPPPEDNAPTQPLTAPVPFPPPFQDTSEEPKKPEEPWH